MEKRPTSIGPRRSNFLKIAKQTTAKSRHRDEAVAAFDSALRGHWNESATYFSELLIEVNFALRLVPRPFTATIIAIEMPAAIRPYSIAVAADSSFRKRANSLDLSKPLFIESSHVPAREMQAREI